MKHLTQFHGQRTQGGDCGPTSLAQSVLASTNGKVEFTTAQLRKFGNIPDRKDSKGNVTFSTFPEDLRDAYRGARERAEELGWDLGKFEIHENEPFQVMRDAVNDGKAVILSIDYGVINKEQPEESGDRKFMGNHSISILPPMSTFGAIEIHDPLCDGRTRTFNGKPYTYPDGATKIDRGVLRKAAETYTSGTGVTFMTIEKAKHIVKEPAKDCTAEIDAVRKPLENKIESLEGQVAELQINIAARNEAIKQTVFDLAKAQDTLRAVVTQ